MSAHAITATIIRAHGEPRERIELNCTCGIQIPAYRRQHSDAPARDAAGFPITTVEQIAEMRTHANQAHAKAGAS